jgi:hypothetical protein
MGRSQDPRHPHASAPLERLDPPECLCCHRRGLRHRARARELLTNVVVTVDEQRELRLSGPKERHGLARSEPGVERDHRHRNVISVLLGVFRKRWVRNVSIAQRMEIRVVDHEARLQVRSRCLGHHLEEVDKRKEAEVPARREAVAQALSLSQFGRCATRPIDDRAGRRGSPDDLAPDPGENEGPLFRGERAYRRVLFEECPTAERSRDERVRHEFDLSASFARLPRVGEKERRDVLE